MSPASGGTVSPTIAEVAVFAPVLSHTAFEETVERIGGAIKLGILHPGSRLPAERQLCSQLGISRSTLRQALTALSQSGHLRAVRGRGGGTFVVERPPGPPEPSPDLVARWRDACDERLAVELGVAVLAAERAEPERLDILEQAIADMDEHLESYPAYRRADVRFHIGLAEATGSAGLVRAMAGAQSAMSDLISQIAHPPAVLEASNVQHARLVAAIRERDGAHAVDIATEHLRATEHILAGLMP